MKRLTIAVDIDDVLAAHAQEFVRFSNERWGTNLTVHDYEDDWSLLWQFNRNVREHQQEMADRADEFFTNIIHAMPHDETARDVLLKLKPHHDLIVVTSRRQQIKGETLVWIQDRFPGVFEQDKIFFAGIWDVIDSSSAFRTKGDILHQLGADYLIDDQPKHCNAAARQGVQAILFGEYGWHDREAVHEGTIRLRNWHEILEYFNAESR